VKINLLKTFVYQNLDLATTGLGAKILMEMISGLGFFSVGILLAVMRYW